MPLQISHRLFSFSFFYFLFASYNPVNEGKPSGDMPAPLSGFALFSLKNDICPYTAMIFPAFGRFSCDSSSAVLIFILKFTPLPNTWQKTSLNPLNAGYSLCGTFVFWCFLFFFFDVESGRLLCQIRLNRYCHIKQGHSADKVSVDCMCVLQFERHHHPLRHSRSQAHHRYRYSHHGKLMRLSDISKLVSISSPSPLPWPIIHKVFGKYYDRISLPAIFSRALSEKFPWIALAADIFFCHHFKHIKLKCIFIGK